MKQPQTLQELKHAVIRGENPILVSDPELCKYIINRQNTKTQRNRLLVYASYVMKYKIKTKDMAGSVSVLFTRDN